MNFLFEDDYFSLLNSYFQVIKVSDYSTINSPRVEKNILRIFQKGTGTYFHAINWWSFSDKPTKNRIFFMNIAKITFIVELDL